MTATAQDLSNVTIKMLCLKEGDCLRNRNPSFQEPEYMVVEVLDDSYKVLAVSMDGGKGGWLEVIDFANLCFFTIQR